MHVSIRRCQVTHCSPCYLVDCSSQVSPEVIKKCFRKAGILNQSLEVVSREVPTEDPFLDLDDQGQVVTDEEVQHLINQLQVENPCSADELASIDDDLAVC